MTNTPGDTADASFSPDGTQIVLAGCPEGGCPSADIYLIPGDGGGPAMRISERNEVQDNDPYFSPDGSAVTWNRNRLTQILPPAGESLALVAPLEGDALGEPTQVGDNQLNAVPTWSLDGEDLYVHRFDFAGTKKWDIVRLAVMTGEMANLTDRHRTGEMADWTFWFPHAGTPSTDLLETPPPSTSDASEVEAPAAPEAPSPADQPTPYGGGLLLVAAVAGSLWSWRARVPAIVADVTKSR